MGMVTRWAGRVLTEYRGLVILLFVLPFGLAFDLLVKGYASAALAVERFMSGSRDGHEERVAVVTEAVRRWRAQPASERRPMCTGRSNWLNLSTRFVDKAALCRIPMAHLDGVLEVDEAAGCVTVEPMVTVGQITALLNPRGWTLACTLEIMDATIGGLAIATGMTTHSHRVGLIQETIEWFEVVLATGEVVRCSREEHRTLFYALPWSHGTLGMVTALRLRIVRCKPFVRLEYIPFDSMDAYCAEMRRLSESEDDPPDFLEATVFARDSAVITAGRFSDAPEQGATVNRVNSWHSEWWYKHCERHLECGRAVEYVPLRHYLLRHNKSLFWVVADMVPFGNAPWFRWLFGWLLPPKPAFLKFSTTDAVRKMTFTHQVFQDIVLPMTSLEESIDLAEELFDTYPILIYPCRFYDHGMPDGAQGQLRPPSTNMYFDLGVYGVPGPVEKKLPYNPTRAYRTMEAFIRRVGGYPCVFFRWPLGLGLTIRQVPLRRHVLRRGGIRAVLRPAPLAGGAKAVRRGWRLSHAV